MSCITLFTFRAAAQQVEAARYEVLNTEIVNNDRFERPLARENQLAACWDVVTDEQGRRRLQMRWKVQ